MISPSLGMIQRRFAGPESRLRTVSDLLQQMMARPGWMLPSRKADTAGHHRQVQLRREKFIF